VKNSGRESATSTGCWHKVLTVEAAAAGASECLGRGDSEMVVANHHRRRGASFEPAWTGG